MEDNVLPNGGWLWKLLSPLIEQFRDLTFATQVAQWMIVTAAVILVIDLISRDIMYLIPIWKRNSCLRKLRILEKDPDEARKIFSDNYEHINGVMSSKFGIYSNKITKQWNEFKETLVDETKNPIENTRRPHEYFMGLARDDSFLLFWANFSVGFGLLFTFLGLVAALIFATDGIDGASAAVMQNNMLFVLNAAAGKFITSIAGVGISLLFRAFAALSRWYNERTLSHLCALLEHGLLYRPPQSIAAQQLNELEEQTRQLKLFNTELSVSLGERFDKAIMPLAGALGQIHETLKTAQEAQTSAVRQGIERMLEASAGHEFEGFARTLSDIRQGLETVVSKLNEGGYEAGRRMEEAAEKLGAAGSAIEERFGSLSKAIREVGERVSEETNQATDALKEQMKGAVASFTSLTNHLQESTTSFAAELQESLHQAIGEATQQGAVAFRRAIEEAADQFGKMSASLSTNLDQAANQFSTLATELKEAEEAISTHADAFSNAAEETAAAGRALHKTIEHLISASEPLQEVPVKITTGLEKFGQNTEAASHALQEATTQLAETARELEQSALASREAWESYKERFGEVDKSLEQFVAALQNAAEENSKRISEFVSESDSALAQAVQKFSGILDVLEDLADRFEEMRHAGLRQENVP